MEKDSFVLGTSVERNSRLVEEEDPAQRRCGVDFGAPTRKVLEYYKKTGNGGRRKLSITENGRVTLAVEGPVAELLSEDSEELEHSTRLDNVKSSLDVSHGVGRYDDVEMYGELDSLVEELESGIYQVR